MFGYVVTNKPEMKFKDYDIYRSFYCGLCHKLKEKYGFSGQISLTYDMTFVVLLLSALYEPDTQEKECRCIVHPVRRQQTRQNEITEYAADMNILFTYYKCMDDWKDEKKVSRLGYARLLSGKNRQLLEKYPEKSRKIIEFLDEISSMEEAGERDIDRISGAFGHIMEEIFVWKEDMWEKSLRKIGFYLGKFIYLLDAYDDVEEDVKSGNYNPFSEKYKIEGFHEYVKSLLMMMMAEACREFEKLPIIIYTDILRNILYSGVWCRFESVGRQRKEAQEKKEDVRSI